MYIRRLQRLLTYGVVGTISFGRRFVIVTRSELTNGSRVGFVHCTTSSRRNTVPEDLPRCPLLVLLFFRPEEWILTLVRYFSSLASCAPGIVG